MTKNVAMDFSIREIAVIAKKGWKTIVVAAIVCAILSGAYSIVSNSNARPVEASDDQILLYETNLAYFDYMEENKDYLTTTLKEKWVSINKQIVEDPLMKLDANNCERIQIVLRFGKETGSYKWTVDNWINNADDEVLFGKATDGQLKRYKKSIIQINTDKNDDNSNETNIILFKVEGFDVKNASNYLIDYFKKQAKVNNIELVAISSSKVDGYCSFISDYQRYVSDRLISFYNSNTNASRTSSITEAPKDPSIGNDSIKKNAIQYVIIGFILGLILGMCLLIIHVCRKNCVISERQMHSSFEIDLLSDFNNGHKVSLDVLDANLDLMTECGSSIMIVGSDNIVDLQKKVEEWNEETNRKYLAGTNIYNDSDTIDALQKVEGIILAVRFGESKIEDIQRIILKAKKLNRKVLGYILI